VLFILANLISFQPRAWDNHKIFLWSYLLLVIPALETLVLLWEKGPLLRSAAVALFLSLSLTGFIDLYRLQRPAAAFQMWDRSDLDIAEKFRKISQPGDLILCSDKVHHWAVTLSGRRVLLGYHGWAWSYGFDFFSMLDEMKTMYHGGEDAEKLMKQYNVRFIAIGPEELSDFGANENYFAQHAKMVLNQPPYRVYQRF
jgi:hypothetical protein